MKENVKAKVREILDNYLELRNHRKTPERYAILDAVYSIKDHFTLEQLSETLLANNFRVSRATLYNTIRLFIELRLVVRHNFQGVTLYEAYYASNNHCHQICTICGKITEISLPGVTQSINEARLRRFRKDGFSLYIYGVCSSCQGKITKRKNKTQSLRNQK
jgi:Fur family ferric uptake transcriptional regulator